MSYLDRNQYYYDNEENYEPDMDDRYFDVDDPDSYFTSSEYLERFYEKHNHHMYTDAGYPYYDTRQVMGDAYAGQPLHTRWCHLNEVPDSYISEDGDVWSTNMMRLRTRSTLRVKKKRYFTIGIWNVGHLLLHRLLAKYFIPNPNRYPIVRHLNDDSEDIRLENLAYGTQLDNVRDSIRNGTYRGFTPEEVERSVAKRRKPVRSINLDTGEIRHHRSMADAGRELGVNQSQISMAVNGQCTRVGNYRFEVIT